MTTETMREAVARALYERLSASVDTKYEELPETWNAPGVITEDEVSKQWLDEIAYGVIRTVLERLREPGDAVIEAGYDILMERGCNPLSEDAQDVWQAMLDAVVREALPESADSGR